MDNLIDIHIFVTIHAKPIAEILGLAIEMLERWMISPYHAKYFAFELTKRYPSNDIQKLTKTLSDAQVDLNPHQVEAALFAFKSPLSTGAILADEVGLGKTIEAGIVLSQFWAERKRRILIISPSNLRKQWSQELSDKFFLPSIIIEAKIFNSSLKIDSNNPFLKDDIVICSYHFARNKEDYINLINWDLVVIDEAHRLRNVYKKSNKISNSIKNSTDSSPRILLTATPLQNSLLELYGLVSFVDEFTFGDVKSFKSQFTRINSESNFSDLRSRLKIVSHRTLRRQVQGYVKFTNRFPLVQEFTPYDDEEQLSDLVANYLKRDSLYALPSSQRQLMTLMLFKLLASSTFAISGTLEKLTAKLQIIITDQEKLKSLFELFQDNIENSDEIAEEWLNGNHDEDDILTENQIEELKKEIEELKKFTDLAKSITKNSKGEVLLTALNRGFKETEKLGGPRKAIIFTESTRTQTYLYNILEDSEYSGKIVLFNGSNNDDLSKKIYNDWLLKHKDTDRITGSKTADKRAAIVDYFRDQAVIMIATEAAAEGINLQFCSLIVNYDLPWNPQRIEQRIGRCHRYGQKYDVVVVNFINKNNVADQRVYQLLDEKFNLFKGVFGASDEVLGSIESGVDFEKRIVQIYKNCRTKEEIENSFNELRNEMEDKIDEKMKITREKLLENFDEEVIEKLKVNLEESKKYLDSYKYKLWLITKFYLEPYAEFDDNEDSFRLIKNPFPTAKIHPGPYRIGRNVEEENIYRVGHPLAEHIIEDCKNFNLGIAELTFDYTGTNKKSSIVEELAGKSGWMKLMCFSINSFESEDNLIFTACLDSGKLIDQEQCRRMFSFPVSKINDTGKPSEQLKGILADNYEEQKANILSLNSERNAGYFETEIEKLDKWAEDKKTSLETKLKELDVDIKAKKTESRKLSKLQEKVKMQREIKDLEKKRNTLRQSLYESQDEVDQRKENLLNEIEERLKHSILTEELFTIKWKIV